MNAYWCSASRSRIMKAAVFSFLLAVMLIGSTLIPARPVKAAPLCYASGEIWLNGSYGVPHSWLHRVNLPGSKYGKLYKAYLYGADITYFAMRIPAGQFTSTYMDFWVSSQLGNVIYPNTRVKTTVTYFC